MHINELAIYNYRNFEKKKINFGNSLNLIVGNNGMGKTNLLESVFLLATGTSHRTNKLKELLKLEEDSMRVTGNIKDNSLKNKIDIRYIPGTGFKSTVNGTKIKRKNLIKTFAAILFSPEDIEDIKNSPSRTRRIIDISISRINTRYIDHLIKYRKLINERNTVLKNEEKKGQSNSSTLKTYTKLLLKISDRVVSQRKEFLKSINKIMKEEAGKMSFEKKYSIRYNESQYQGEKSLEKDIEYGHTTWGPHRDKYKFYLDDLDLRSYGSRGEVRTAIFIYRLAVWKLLKRKKDSDPVILLDDIFSELDDIRSNKIKKRIKGVQSIITCTKVPEELENIKDSSKMKVIRL
ncbi:MAG: DNA replication/repair protein RecF [Elusimicrobiota bacterium]